METKTNQEFLDTAGNIVGMLTTAALEGKLRGKGGPVSTAHPVIVDEVGDVTVDQIAAQQMAALKAKLDLIYDTHHAGMNREERCGKKGKAAHQASIKEAIVLLGATWASPHNLIDKETLRDAVQKLSKEIR